MTEAQAQALVRLHLNRNAYLRVPNPARIKDERATYRKGYECRFPTNSGEEAMDLISALWTIGVRPGNKFEKHNQVVVPVYGQDQVEKLLRLRDPLVGESGPDAP